MKLTSESKLFLAMLGSMIVIIGIALFAFSKPAKPILKQEAITPTTNKMGNPSASVWLVEFSDYECPACKIFAPVVEKIGQTYPDKILIAYRHFPIGHPYSVKAGIAAEAAGKQGKFFEMSSLLFAERETLTDEKVQTFAKQLNLDMEQFTKDLADPALSDKITTDSMYGKSLGINSTPTFYLNGVKLNIGNLEDLEKAVEKAMQQ